MGGGGIIRRDPQEQSAREHDNVGKVQEKRLKRQRSWEARRDEPQTVEGLRQELAKLELELSSAVERESQGAQLVASLEAQRAAAERQRIAAAQDARDITTQVAAVVQQLAAAAAAGSR